MTAWFLAERGLRVTLCEKGRIAGEQSSRNWGWIRQQGRHPAARLVSEAGAVEQGVLAAFELVELAQVARDLSGVGFATTVTVWLEAFAFRTSIHQQSSASVDSM